MRVPHSWLGEVVELEEPISELADRLSMTGFEVEALEDLGTNSRDLVVGYVVKKEKHPKADKLSVCQVDVGRDENLQIVCGASNIRTGINVIVACVGSKLPHINLTIKKSAIRDITSEGMICSLSEIGLESKSEGIAILDDISTSKPVIGDSVNKYLGTDDVIIELAITANRPDGMSIIGIAREVAAITKSELKIPKVVASHTFNKLNKNKNNGTLIGEIDIFTISKLENLHNECSTPSSIKNRLRKCGINSKNPIVDITNYVMLENGQPFHAYDANKLRKLVEHNVEESSFGIREGRKGEQFQTIDGKEIELGPTIVVITCEDVPISIAGVIGGIETCIDSTTTDIWLESAVFSQKTIRKSSRSIGIRTESSGRFEKGVCSEETESSTKRAIDLLVEYSNAKNIKSWMYPIDLVPPRSINLTNKKINQILGCLSTSSEASKDICRERFIPDNVIESNLKLLGCILTKNDNGWSVISPPWRRKDLMREIDLIEEIARLVGYDNFDNKLPCPLVPGGLTSEQRAERSIRNKLCSIGLQEITTMSLVGLDSKDTKRIQVANPLLAETSCLRTKFWEEHLKITERNLRNRNTSCWFYEIGKVYEANESHLSETRKVAGVISGNKNFEKWTPTGKKTNISYFEARGLLQELFHSLKLDVRDDVDSSNSLVHPGRNALLILEGKVLGYFGEIHPAVLEEYDISMSTYIFEIDYQHLVKSSTRKNKLVPTFKDFSTLPSLDRDISLYINSEIPISDVMLTIKKAGKSLLKGVELIDRYEAKDINATKVSLTFRLNYKDDKQTLTEEVVNPIHENIRRTLREKLDVELRS